MRRIPPIDPVGLSAITLLVGAVLSVLLAFAFEGQPALPGVQVVWVIVILGLVQTALANLLRIVVIRSAGPTFMSLTNYMVPVWSVVLGVLVLREPIESTLFIAVALILVGVLVSQWGALNRLFAKSR